MRWDWVDGNPVAEISDDGCGMSEEALLEAMRFGGMGPQVVRSETDLGRFGLGLKTASFSQCRSLSVVSKTAEGTFAFTWDLDQVEAAGGAWSLIDGADGLPSDSLDALATRPSGTLVVWRKVDFGRASDFPSHAAFLSDLERSERHLGMIFHRFLRGDARRISIFLNGREISPWDPFMENHPATNRSPELRVRTPGGLVRARGFVLPHRDQFRSEQEYEAAGGIGGWTVHQGFYVYRQKRLLSAGGWLGLGGSRAWTREEPSRLARIAVDIPNTADQDWRIDIRKAIARPPDTARRALLKIAEDIRSKAREVFIHRGNHGPRSPKEEVARMWDVAGPDDSRRYKIRRDHDLVALLNEQLDDTGRGLLGALLDQIERTVPVERVWFDVHDQGVPARAGSDNLVDAAMSIARMMVKTGIPIDEAASRIHRMDPFDTIENLPEKLLQAWGS